MGCMACTEPQCMYKGALYLYLYQFQLTHKVLPDRFSAHDITLHGNRIAAVCVQIRPH